MKGFGHGSTPWVGGGVATLTDAKDCGQCWRHDMHARAMDAENSRMRSLLACLGDRSRFRVVASCSMANVRDGAAARVGLPSRARPDTQALAREGSSSARAKASASRSGSVTTTSRGGAGSSGPCSGRERPPPCRTRFTPTRCPATWFRSAGRRAAPTGRMGKAGRARPCPRLRALLDSRRELAPTVPAPSPSYTVPDSTSSLVEPDSPRERFVEAPTPPRQEPAPLDRTELGTTL